MELSVIIPAAGESRRFGGDKLNQDLGGRPVLLRTVEIFTKRPEVRSIIVAGPPDRLDEFRFRFGDRLAFHGVTIVPGGKRERWETVRNALAAVPDSATHIAVHDAARPALSVELLDRLVEAARVLPAVIPGVPLNFTVKRVGERAVAAAERDPIADAILGDAAPTPEALVVEQTVERRGLYEIQTPQIFRADLLRRAYARDDLDGATDDASVVERLGEEVYVVEGDSRNLKVTTPADLDLVRAILNVAPPKDRPTHKRF